MSVSYNYTLFEECKAMFAKRLGKDYSQFTSTEKVLLTNITEDRMRGRMSKFLQWSNAERTCFLNWLTELDVCYLELSDAERWAYEDAFGFGNK